MPAQQETLIATGFEYGALINQTSESWHQNTSGDATIQSVTRRTGTYAIKLVPTTTTPAVSQMLYSPTNNRPTDRFYIRFATLPDADCFLAYENAGGAMRAGIAFKQINSTIRAFHKAGASAATFSADGPVVTTGVWYRIDMHTELDTAPTPDTHTTDWQVDGVAQGQLVTGVNTAGYSGFVYGNGGGSGNANGEWYIDDHVGIVDTRNSATDFPVYPIGAGFVTLLGPNGVGTHVNAGSFTDDAANSPPVTPHLRLDEIPISTAATDYIAQTTIGTGDYIELTLIDLPGDATSIHGVWLAGSFANALAANLDVDFIDTDAQNVKMPAPNSNSRLWSSNGHPGRTTQWTAASINGGVIRIGLSDDVTPAPRSHDCWIEVAYDTTPLDNEGWGWGEGEERWSYV